MATKKRRHESKATRARISKALKGTHRQRRAASGTSYHGQSAGYHGTTRRRTSRRKG